jgi:hypothetical protein
MEIKRKTDIFIETRRQFVISEPETNVQISCPRCQEMMLTAEQAADFFGISRRIIYQFVETGAVHFVENETDAVMICFSSLAAILDGEARKNQIPMPNKAANTD